MRILYFGSKVGNSGSRVKGMRMLGHTVDFVFERGEPLDYTLRVLKSLEWRLCNGPTTLVFNHLMVKRAVAYQPDIFWTEMGKLVYPSTIRKIRERCGCIMVNTYSDDFLDPMKRSRQYTRSIPHYDHIFTPRKINFPELYACGAQSVHMFWKGYNPDMHFPETLTPEEMKLYGTDVVFIGHGEPSRVEPFNRLAEVIPNMKVWGNEWHKCTLPEPLRSKIQFRGAEFDEYRKAMCGAKIGIQYLSLWARDGQASRSFEIPACGVFMLADRSEEHQASFEEGKEAEFFSSTDELVDKAKFYLAHDDLRRRIAQAGHRRCVESGYSNYDRIKTMLDAVTERVPSAPTIEDSAKHKPVMGA